MGGVGEEEEGDLPWCWADKRIRLCWPLDYPILTDHVTADCYSFHFVKLYFIEFCKDCHRSK